MRLVIVCTYVFDIASELILADIFGRTAAIGKNVNGCFWHIVRAGLLFRKAAIYIFFEKVCLTHLAVVVVEIREVLHAALLTF